MKILNMLLCKNDGDMEVAGADVRREFH
jgi:hypothetical protein